MSAAADAPVRPSFPVTKIRRPLLRGSLVDRARVEADVATALRHGGVTLLAELVAADWRGALDAHGLAVLQRWLALVRQLRGGTSPAATAEMPSAAAPPAGVQPLSEREQEVLQRIAVGDSNKLIARQLDLSPHTVKRHVANILDKLGLASRGQAAAWHRANGVGT